MLSLVHIYMYMSLSINNDAVVQLYNKDILAIIIRSIIVCITGPILLMQYHEWKFSYFDLNSLKSVPKGPVVNNWLLVQVMAWRRIAITWINADPVCRRI